MGARAENGLIVTVIVSTHQQLLCSDGSTCLVKRHLLGSDIHRPSLSRALSFLPRKLTHTVCPRIRCNCTLVLGVLTSLFALVLPYLSASSPTCRFKLAQFSGTVTASHPVCPERHSHSNPDAGVKRKPNYLRTQCKASS